MAEYSKLKENLLTLANLEITLERQGGPAANRQLFEQVYTLKEGILKSFGLPGTPENDQIIWFTEVPTDLEIEERSKQLRKRAEEYLLSSPESDLQILTEAREQKKNPFEILPLLKITPHGYTIFVYNQILLPGKDTAENVLHELKLANQTSILGMLGNLQQGNTQNPEELISKLKAQGLKYTGDFLKAINTERARENSDSLLRFLNEINHKEHFNNNDEFFDSLTTNLMNYLCLVVGKNAYRITECEIYYMDSEHPDPYVHCGNEQLTSGHLYLNKTGGLDITFGNANNPTWGGIFIRGIRNMETNEYINNPTEITAEIFKALGNIIVNQNRIYLAEFQTGQVRPEIPFRTPRVELERKEHDPDNFFEKPYRYIVEFVPSHKFVGKENIVKQLLTDNKITGEQAKDILGYSLR